LASRDPQQIIENCASGASDGESKYGALASQGNRALYLEVTILCEIPDEKLTRLIGTTRFSKSLLMPDSFLSTTSEFATKNIVHVQVKCARITPCCIEQIDCLR
jgi:hypothetical protein